MSKTKEKVDELRAKLFDRKKTEITEEAVKTVDEANMDNIVYDVIQNPDKAGRNYVIVKIEYDLKTKTAKIVQSCEFLDKAAGLTIQMNKANLKYLFDRNNRGNK